MSTKRIAVKGSTLKWIAIITMLIDHIGATLVWGIVSGCETGSEAYQRWHITYVVMRVIGRLAFPIFCYLLVEGIRHTSNTFRYGFRLLLFAFLSELPFDYAFNGGWFMQNSQNVFFTLFFGFAAVECMRWIRAAAGQMMSFAGQLLSWLPTLICMLFANLLKTDYSALGVLTVVLLYQLSETFPQKRKGIGFAVAMIPLAVGNIFEIPVFLDAFLIQSYDGTRGRQMKYFFYLFYPAHLLLLAVLYHWNFG